MKKPKDKREEVKEVELEVLASIQMEVLAEEP